MFDNDDKEEEGKRENAFIGTNSRTVKCNGGKSVVFLSCLQVSSTRRFHVCCRVSLKQVRKSLTHTGVPRVPLFLCSPHLTSYLILSKLLVYSMFFGG